MAGNLGEMWVTFGAKLDNLTSGVARAKEEIGSVGGAAEHASGGIKGMLGNAVSFATGGAAFLAVGNAVGFLKGQLSDAFQQSLDAQAGMAQTVKVLQSTHDASGMTAQSIADLSTQYSHLTKFSDDTVQASENMLLTFTNIGKNVFPQATKTVLDMSQALGQDTKSSAIQLGKALNDPLTGITALSRVGVTFDTQQKNLIKTYMAHNDIAKAQGIILKELQREFGGSAEAAGKTFGGQLAILHQRLDDVRQNIGDALLPQVTKLMGFVSNAVIPGLTSFSGEVLALAGPAFNKLGEALQAVGKFLQPFGSLFQFAAFTAKNAFKDVSDTMTQVGQIFKSVMNGLGGSGGENPVVMFFSNIISKAYPIIQNLGQSFHDFMMTLQKDLSTVNPQDLIGAFTRIQGAVSGLLSAGIERVSATVQFLGQVFSSIKGAVEAVAPIFLRFATDILPGLESAFQQVFTIVAEQHLQNFRLFGQLIQQIGGWVQSTLAPALERARPGFEHLANALLTSVVPGLAKIWAVGQQVMRDVLPLLMQWFERAAPIVVQVGGAIADKLGGALQFLMPYIVQAAQTFGKFVGEIATRLAPLINQFFDNVQSWIHTFSQVWTATWPYLSQILKGAWDVIVGVVKIAWSVVSGIIKIGLDVLSGNWGQAWTDMKDMLGGVFDGIGTVLHGALGMLGNIISGAATGLWHLLSDPLVNLYNSTIGPIIGQIGKAIGDISSGNFGGLASTMHLPGFATGGISPGGPIVVAEGGPEIIAPPAGSHIYNASQTAAMLAGATNVGQGDVYVQVVVGGEELTNVVAKKMDAHVRAKRGPYARVV